MRSGNQEHVSDTFLHKKHKQTVQITQITGVLQFSQILCREIQAVILEAAVLFVQFKICTEILRISIITSLYSLLL